MADTFVRGPQGYAVVDGHRIDVGSLWRRKIDGARYEVVWMQEWPALPLRVQVRREGATNLKNTHWLDAENLLRLYTLASGRQDP